LHIGLSQRILYYKSRAYDSLEHGWYSFLKDHTLYPVPNNTDIDFEAIADTIDLYIITGGDDSTLRRTVELKMASTMLKRNKPIIGICHGAFLLTDILGGKVEETMCHSDVLHQVNYFGEQVWVNSYHNLAITKTHGKAIVLATDEEQNCEAWIDGNIAGVVWHPERMDSPWIPDEIENLIFKGKK
jgi:gamma-glutamyl-gamma-aminobutyrate hydrolase PuuD